MKITYKPKDKSEAPATTNIGTFQPGESKVIGEEQETEARRLIAAGHFVEAGLTKAEAKAEADEEKATAPVETAKKK